MLPLFYQGQSAFGWLNRWLLLVLASVCLVAPTPTQAQALSGAIFTSDVTCNGTDLNIFKDKQDVYLNGGPRHPGSAGLPDGSYYVKVTNPSGSLLLGTSVGAVNERPATAIGGSITPCLQLYSALIRPNLAVGYNDTDNNGGEYKVWVSMDPGFPNGATKTDNFKVKSDLTTQSTPMATLKVIKFYDTNADGTQNFGEIELIDWKVAISGCITNDRYTPVSALVDPGICTVTEYMPNETNWLPTTAVTQSVTLADQETKTVAFGNICLGKGGGLTLGFWSNKNGAAAFTAYDLSSLVQLNLRNANGSAFDPASYAAFRTWILNATATNMANMLSAQLAAMRLNVNHSFVNGSALIYAPGVVSANAIGFASVSAVMAEADQSLGQYGLTLSGHSQRAYQEALKNALDRANNNLTFVQSTPCPFSFP